MATNPESEPQVRNIDGQEQQIEAVRLLREYNAETQKIIRLTGELNQQGKPLTEPEIVEIKKGISECENRRENLRGRMEQEYHVQTPRQLDIALKQRGVEFADPQYDYLAGLPQQNQSQFQGSQNEARGTSLEKDIAVLEGLQESLQHLKKAMDEADRAKMSYQLMEEGYRKAFEVMQRVNHEIMESNRLLREAMRTLPQPQSDTIISPDVIKGHGTDSVNVARFNIRKSLENYEQDRQQKSVGEPPEQPKEVKPREESKPGGLVELYEGNATPHHTAVRGRAENREKPGDLSELYKDKEPQHHEAERGRAEERGKQNKKGYTPT